jgi:energy-coupling factor transport system permease protein
VVETQVSDQRLALGAAAIPRWLHPGAWWVWALGLAAAASRTTNPLLLILIVCCAAIVVSARKPVAPWARSFGFFLRLGVVIIIVRVLAQVLFGASLGTTVILDAPGIALPDWFAGVRLGGEITLESLLFALFDGMRLATIIACVGAANSLASPSRLLKSVPAALYEVGVSVVVALTFAPQLVSDISRVSTARRLRGRTTRGVRAIAGSTVPVFEGALERSVQLAAAMDSRGYGRTAGISPASRKLASICLLAGLVAACIGTYALVAADSPVILGLPLLTAGLLVSILAITMAARRSVRTRYRPDPWWLAEWLVAASGLVAATVFAWAAWSHLVGITTPTDPAQWPLLPLAPVFCT